MSSRETEAPARVHRGAAPNQAENQPRCVDLARINPSDSNCRRSELHRYSGGSTSSLPHSNPAERMASISLQRTRQSTQPCKCAAAPAESGPSGCSSSICSNCAHWIGLMGISFRVATCLRFLLILLLSMTAAGAALGSLTLFACATSFSLLQQLTQPHACLMQL